MAQFWRMVNAQGVAEALAGFEAKGQTMTLIPVRNVGEEIKPGAPVEVAFNPALIELANHIIGMGDDAYLTGHPEWMAIVEEAKAAVKLPKGSFLSVGEDVSADDTLILRRALETIAQVRHLARTDGPHSEESWRNETPFEQWLKCARHALHEAEAILLELSAAQAAAEKAGSAIELRPDQPMIRDLSMVQTRTADGMSSQTHFGYAAALKEIQFALTWCTSVLLRFGLTRADKTPDPSPRAGEHALTRAAQAAALRKR